MESSNQGGLPSAEEVKKMREAMEAQLPSGPTKEEIEKAREEIARMMAEPIDPEDAARTLADIEVQKAQLGAYAVHLAGQSAQIEAQVQSVRAQLAGLDCDAAVIRRRMLNKAGDAS